MACVMTTLMPSALSMEHSANSSVGPIAAASAASVAVQVQLCEDMDHCSRVSVSPEIQPQPRPSFTKGSSPEEQIDGWCSEDDCMSDNWNPALYSLQMKAPKAAGLFCPNLVPSSTNASHFGDVFHGLIAQAEAAEVLLGHQDGSFLVRETSSGKHILSLMFNQKMVNYTLQYDGQHYLIGEKQFETLDSLVDDVLISLYIATQFNVGEQLEQARSLQRSKTQRRLKQFGDARRKRSKQRQQQLDTRKNGNNETESDLDWTPSSSPSGSLISLEDSSSSPLHDSPAHTMRSSGQESASKLQRKGARRKKVLDGKKQSPVSVSCSELDNISSNNKLNGRRTLTHVELGLKQMMTLNSFDSTVKASSLPQGVSAPVSPPQQRKFHNFKLTTYKSPTWCAVCHHFMWGLTQQGSRCNDCGMDVHKQCIVTAVDIKCTPNRKMIKKVFGVDLNTLTALEEATVPSFLVRSLIELEQRGLSEEGIYRVSGYSRLVNEIKERAHDGDSIDFSTLSDIHTITGAIKLFLRDLPIPLITYSAYPYIMSSLSECTFEPEGEENLVPLREALYSCLPKAHYHTLHHLIQHLHRVDQLSAANKMHANNLAVVFAPTIMRGGINEETALEELGVQKKLVSCLIKNIDDLFLYV